MKNQNKKKELKLLKLSRMKNMFLHKSIRKQSKKLFKKSKASHQESNLFKKKLKRNPWSEMTAI